MTGENGTQLGTSIFGEPLSEERVNHIENWIPAPTDESAIDSVTAVGSAVGWNEVESLPQLMSVLENVTQMADRFQATEKQKSLVREEEIRTLTSRCSKPEQKLQTTTEAFESADKERAAVQKQMSDFAQETEAFMVEKEGCEKERQKIKADKPTSRTTSKKQ